MTSPPSPNRARPNPSPSPAPGLAFGAPRRRWASWRRRTRIAGSRVANSSWARVGRAECELGVDLRRWRHGQRRVQAARQHLALGDAVGRAREPRVERQPDRATGARNTRTQDDEQKRVRHQRAGPALFRLGRPEFPLEERRPRLERRDERWIGRGSLAAAARRPGDRRGWPCGGTRRPELSTRCAAIASDILRRGCCGTRVPH